ncbi:MAG: TetR/AcrR family transcriptional regulator [Lachnospiraceae bacterium]|nr:TetR/AcrR family transcriptional regulator [Lachnospiraceae bacterium]
MAKRRERMLDAAYRLFCKKSITSVSFNEIAEEAGCGKRTIIRYFDSKPRLVIAVAVRQWKLFMEKNHMRRPKADFEGMTAADIFEFYLDSFLELYKTNKDLLRFNQFFNIYVLSEGVQKEDLGAYGAMITELKHEFHNMYEKAKKDGTIRTDIPEKEMFSTTLHLMLAVITRYAVGLVYRPENAFDDIRELQFQKKAILSKYKSDIPES